MAQGLYGNQAVGKWAQEALLHQPVTLSPERESTRNCSLMVLCVFARVRQGADYAVGLHFVLHLGFLCAWSYPGEGLCKRVTWAWCSFILHNYSGA